MPQEWLAIINSYGGDMGETYGVPVEEIQEGIKHGESKVNDLFTLSRLLNLYLGFPRSNRDKRPGF